MVACLTRYIFERRRDRYILELSDLYTPSDGGARNSMTAHAAISVRSNVCTPMATLPTGAVCLVNARTQRGPTYQQAIPRGPLHVPVAQQSADTPEAEGGATAGGDPSVRACVVPASPGLGAIASAFSRCSVPVCV